MTKKPLHIDEVFVLRKHITKGTQKSCSSCAIALALKDHFKVNDLVQVFGGSNMLVYNTFFKVMLADSFKVQSFINQFDVNKSKTQPFSFRIIYQ